MVRFEQDGMWVAHVNTEAAAATADDEQPTRFPALLAFAGRRVLVVGAGDIGTRRAASLVDVGADVHVVAPTVSDHLHELAANDLVTIHGRQFDDRDLEGCWFAITATGVPDVDSRVARSAESLRVWCVNASDARNGTAAMPARADGPDGISVAVSGGSDPGRARAIRDAIAALLMSNALPTRRTRSREPAVASKVGRVTLLGAGPGDPELVTVKGMRAIAQADVLVVDRLAPASLWEDPGPGVTVVEVGKAPGRHTASQESINATLIEHAQAGRSVVRIKGGDPFVLGRGGEEALACVEAGIPVEVIPGITSAIAVPGAAGIPVTHRSLTSSFVMASAHDGPAGVLAAVGNAAPTSTIVLLMGARLLADIAEALIESGRDPHTPLAVVESGWTDQQRTTVSTLGKAAVGLVDAQPPAVVVIGHVVELRDVLGDLARPSLRAGHAVTR